MVPVVRLLAARSREDTTLSITVTTRALAICLLAGTVGATPTVAGSQRPGAAQLNALLDSVVPAALSSSHLPGAVIAVVRNDSVVALRGFGFARLEDSTHADPGRSIYRLASVAKLFVATVVLEQVERGALALDGDVTRYVPDVRIPPAFGSPISIRNLLTHTAGLDERVIGYAARSAKEMHPLGEYLAARLPDRGWPPGLLVSYSNHGMALAAYAAEHASGVPFRELAGRELFGPLGMTRTYYVAPADSTLLADRAPGYRCGVSGCNRIGEVWSHAYPVGLAFTTAADMAAFMRAQLNGGLLDGRQVVPPAVITASHTRQFTHDSRLPGIGFAFFEQEHRGTRLLTHAGGVPGSATVLALVPSERVGVFIATNAGEPGFTRAVLDAVLDAMLPATTLALPRAIGPVQEYAGHYLLARYSHRTIERFPGAFAFAVTARAHGDTLSLTLGSDGRKFVRVDSLLLQEVGGGTRLVVRRNSAGRVSHLFTGIPAGGAELPGALERVPWYEGAYFLNEYASWLILVPAIVLLLWGVGALVLVFRRRGTPRSATPHDVWARRVAVLLAVVVVLGFGVFGFGLIASSNRDLGRGQGIAFGMDGGTLALLRMAWPLTLAALPIAWLCLTAWRRRWWNAASRACYTLLTLTAAGVSHFLIWWEYVPGRW